MMLNLKSSKSSFDGESELPLYKTFNCHVAASHPMGLISRSSTPSPMLVAIPTSPPLLIDEKANIMSHELRGSKSFESEDVVEDRPSKLKVLGAVIFYLVAATVMVFANKWVLRAVAVPITFLLCQLLIATGFLQVAGSFGLFEIPRLNLHTAKSLLPLILINVVGLLFNTFCLQHVDASFYQVARGLVLPFTVLASYLFLESRPSLSILSSVLVVCVGFLWGVQTDKLYTSRMGVTLGVLSSITTSIHAIIVKRSLSVTNSPIELAYYNNLFSAVLLLPLIPFTSEIGAVGSLVRIGGEPFKTFVTGALVTGIFGFLISLAGFLSIKITSPVTHMVSSAVRGVLQSVFGIILFHDVITVDRFIGITIILGGSIAYTAIKDQENRPERAHIKKNTGPLQLNSSNLSFSKTVKHLKTKLVC